MGNRGVENPSSAEGARPKHTKCAKTNPFWRNGMNYMKLGRNSVGRNPRGFDIPPRPRGTVSLPKDSNPFYWTMLHTNELREIIRPDVHIGRAQYGDFNKCDIEYYRE